MRLIFHREKTTGFLMLVQNSMSNRYLFYVKFVERLLACNFDCNLWNEILLNMSFISWEFSLSRCCFFKGQLLIVFCYLINLLIEFKCILVNDLIWGPRSSCDFFKGFHLFIVKTRHLSSRLLFYVLYLVQFFSCITCQRTNHTRWLALNVRKCLPTITRSIAIVLLPRFQGRFENNSIDTALLILWLPMSSLSYVVSSAF